MKTARSWLITTGIGLGLVALPVLGVVGLYLLTFGVFRLGDVAVPDFPRAEWVRPNQGDLALVQGWKPDEVLDYHHRSQGTVILPAAWFRALEQPLLTPLPVGLFADRAYLRRFGFNYDQVPEGLGGIDPSVRELPIGFAVEGVLSPDAPPPWNFAERTEIMGLTCAACHTGRIDLKRDGLVRSVLIEGGGAMIDLKQFQNALGRALYFTQQSPERFRRFARRVRLDPNWANVSEDAISQRLDAAITAGSKVVAFATEHRLFPVEAGFGRTDALDLIGNQVFGMTDDQNQAVADAPVNYPHLWDTSWFDWVQYNASIRTPMARNIGEALGVLALLKLGEPGPGSKLLGSVWTSVNVKNLAWMEELLGGPDPLATGTGPGLGLQPPRWEAIMASLVGHPSGSPAALPEPVNLDPVLVRDGRELYRKHCQGCHLHPRDELQAKLKEGTDFAPPRTNFTDPDRVSQKRFLKLPVIDLDVIGTDPNQALNFYRRVVVSKDYPAQEVVKGVNPASIRVENATIAAEVGLYRVTSMIRAQKYAELDLYGKNAAERMTYDRYRSVPEKLTGDDIEDDLTAKLDTGDPAAIKSGASMGDVITPNLGYKARPLDGVWATPPFLHNGSVPTLDDLLHPWAERPVVFYTGSTLYDPIKVGYQTTAFEGATQFDTRISGNRNTGHEFRDLTLDEMEATAGIVPTPGTSTNQRMARVLGVPSENFNQLDEPAIRALIRQFSQALSPATSPTTSMKGRIGPALDNGERARLLAYLKSI